MKKLVLFDFDGTVADNSEGIYNCIRYALSKMNRSELPESVLRTFIGPSLFDSFMDKCESDEEKANLFVSLYRERYAPVGSTEVKIYDGIKQLLAKLKSENIKVAVCSSKPYDFVRKITKEQGIEELFDGFFCPGFSSHVSDKSGLALEAVKYFDVKKEDTVLVGDTKFDILAAKKAEISSIGVRYGFAEENELENAGADKIADTPFDIYELL